MITISITSAEVVMNFVKLYEDDIGTKKRNIDEMYTV